MRTKLVAIGNSRGIRIPKAILEQCAMPDEVELAVEGQHIIVSPAQREPRKGWREAAERMAAAGDDELLVPDVLEDDIDVDWE